VADRSITVGIPVHNGEDFLEIALDSVLNQTRPPDNVLIYDNASEDSSFEIAKSFAIRYPFISAMQRSENVGAARNFNELVADSSSTYFCWLCHDDTWDTDLLDRSFEAMESNPDASVAFAVPNWIDADGESIGCPPPVIWSDSADASTRARDLLSHDIHSLLFDCNAVHGLIRRSCLEKTRMIRPYPSGDVPLIFELALHGRLQFVPDTHFNRRQHGRTSMNANSDNWTRQQFYDPTEKRAPAELLERFRDFLGSTAKSELSRTERTKIEASVIHWAARSDHPRRIVGQLVRRVVLR